MLDITRDQSVSVLRLERPDRRNALSLELCRLLHRATQDEVDNGARALVITGSGSAFCSGADLDGVYGDEFIAVLYGMLHGLTRLPVPVVAAINGPAIGAGTQLALACDLRVVAPAATFGVPTARNGMAVDAWTVRTLVEIAGGGMARRLMIAAEVIDRDAALGCGLADRTGDLDEAIGWAHELAGLAPLAIRHSKTILAGGSDEEIAATFAACWASEDVQESARARQERRAPVFRGR